MIAVRWGVFETNSSSTHSVAMYLWPKEYQKLYLHDDGKYHVKFRNFDGRCEHIQDLSDKIAFLLQLSMQGQGVYNYLDSSAEPSELEEDYEILLDLPLYKEIQSALMQYDSACKGLVVDRLMGTIDHQTATEYYRGEDFLEDQRISLRDFLFGNTVLIADHD